jgi:hypothetical protein
MTSTERVIGRARELIDGTAEGVRYSALHRAICAAYGDIPSNTVHGALHKFRTELPEEYYLPVRGLYRHVKYRSEDAQITRRKMARKADIKEEDFYEAFADWIVNELHHSRAGLPGRAGHVLRQQVPAAR